MLKILGVAGYIQCRGNDGDEVMGFGLLELFAFLAVGWVYTVFFTGDETELGGHGEMGDGDVDGHVDFTEEGELLG